MDGGDAEGAAAAAAAGADAGAADPTTLEAVAGLPTAPAGLPAMHEFECAIRELLLRTLKGKGEAAVNALTPRKIREYLTLHFMLEEGAMEPIKAQLNQLIGDCFNELHEPAAADGKVSPHVSPQRSPHGSPSPRVVKAEAASSGPLSSSSFRPASAVGRPVIPAAAPAAAARPAAAAAAAGAGAGAAAPKPAAAAAPSLGVKRPRIPVPPPKPAAAAAAAAAEGSAEAAEAEAEAADAADEVAELERLQKETARKLAQARAKAAKLGAAPASSSAAADDDSNGRAAKRPKVAAASSSAAAGRAAGAAPKGVPNSDGGVTFAISDKRNVSVRQFKGRPLVDIREFYEKDGAQLPGKKGISLSPDQWQALVSALPQISAALNKL